MTGTSHASSTAANPTCGGIEKPCGLGKIFRALWPIKTAAELSEKAGISRRKAEYILAGDKSLSGADLIALLRSDHGLHVLTALMGTHRPRWWRDLRRASDLADLRRRQEEQRRLIERLEREAGD
jgi:hypothetical protein